MFTIEVEIGRSPDVVFGYLADVENTPAWYSAVERAERLTTAPTERGSRFSLVRALPSGEGVNEVEITEFAPPSLITLASRSGPTPFTYRYRLAPSAGGTRLTLEGEISGEGLGGPLALLAPLAANLFQRGMRTNLAMLKRLIEAR